MKEDRYLIFFIKRTLTQSKDTKYIIKTDICQTFHQLKILKNLEKSITILRRFNIYTNIC